METTVMNVAPTAEEIEAAKLVLANAEVQNDEAATSDATTETPIENPTPQRTIDPELVARLNDLLEKATRSPFYMSNLKRVAALEKALKIPVSDDKSFQLFYNHSQKDLERDAGRKAVEVKDVPIMPTIHEIIEEAQKRYVAKHGERAVINEEYEA
jgi:hypothetical protein